MPYIRRANRPTARHTPKSAGELNYAFTRLIVGYLDYAGLNYQTINDILGALEGAKMEFDRRKVRAYEAAKRVANGDVY